MELVLAGIVALILVIAPIAAHKEAEAPQGSVPTQNEPAPSDGSPMTSATDGVGSRVTSEEGSTASHQTPDVAAGGTPAPKRLTVQQTAGGYSIVSAKVRRVEEPPKRKATASMKRVGTGLYVGDETLESLFEGRGQ